MKNIIFQIMLVLFIQEVLGGDDDLLAKFHQNNYKIKDVRTQVLNYDKNIYHYLKVITFKYNRTTAAHNLTTKLKVDVHDKLEVVVQVYKFLSNEYRYFPIRFQMNLRKAQKANVGGLAKTIRCGNTTTFYFYKDITYHVCNFVLDATCLPPLIPNGQFKIELQVLYLTKTISLINIFGEVYTPIVYPKK